MTALTSAIGLMSGTSLDGIDAAFIETDGARVVTQGPWLTLPYSRKLREALRAVLGGVAPASEVAAVERSLTEAHAEAVARLRQRHGIGAVDLVGFHGHTILHAPEEGRTWQIGDGARLAALTGIDVVSDFRSADVAGGGEGAPLAPVYHAALAEALEKPLAVLNIGGVANVTWIGVNANDLLAFDTGPGNAMIDDWVRARTGAAADYDGVLASEGKVDEAALARFLAHPYFERRPPKSLDRDQFAAFMPEGLSAADGAATLAAMTASAVARGARDFPAAVRRWIITGGGRHNPSLMDMLARRLGPDARVESAEAVGWEGDAIEAQAFGYLAVRSRKNLPLSLPGTTGVRVPICGGRLFLRPV